MDIPNRVVEELGKIVGKKNVRTDLPSLLLNAYDCSRSRMRPDIIVHITQTAQLASVICATTTEELRVEIPYIPFSEPVRKTLNKIRDIKKKLYKAQTRYDIETPININPYFSSLIELWVEGAEWETVSEQVDMGEGDIVRAFKRVVDVLRQLTTIDNVPEAVVFTAREAIEKIMRAPVDVD